MKTATLPLIRIEPAFRQEMEQSLQGNESLESFVEVAVRNEIRRRQAQADLVRRGCESVQRSTAIGDGIPAEVAIARLEAKLAAAKQRR